MRAETRIVSALTAALIALGPTAEAREWRVPAEGSLADVLHRTENEDRVVVDGGVHRGPFTLDRSIVLEGAEGAVLDGGGSGTVVSILAADTTVRGFTIRGSGASLDEENSGVAVEAPRANILSNRLEDVLFGIYLRKASGGVVEDNTIVGKDLELARRGDAIRVWYSDDTTLRGNRVFDARDVVLWYSSRLEIQGNLVERGRYGLHFMYCDDTRIVENRLLDNSVGAFLMYSRRLHLERNAIAGNHGPSGYGVGLKDMDDPVILDNVLAGNRIGVYLDNSPREVKSTVQIRGNLFAGNDVGISLLPNVRRASVVDNSMVENLRAVEIAGGGGAPESNSWRGNYWSDYAGYDGDGDGIGDVPYRSEKLFGLLADSDPKLRFFSLGPATEALDFASRAFPIVRPRPRLVDLEPRMRPVAPTGVPSTRSGESDRGTLLATGGGLLALSTFLLLAPGRIARRLSHSRSSDLELLPRASDATTDAAEALETSKEVDSATTSRAVTPHAQTPATPPTEALVEVDGLSKVFGDRPALRGVSFRVRRGESLALWGPNGAGKTTALRAILGVLPAGGTVRIGGHDPWRDGKAARRLVGFVPQDVTLPADRTVDDTLVLLSRLRRVPEKRIDVLLEQVGLEDEVEKTVGALSGGLRQRLALAAALLADPPLLLLDEPTANLDARSRADFLELLDELRRAGKTLIFSSHRPEEVRALADRVLCLEDGLLVADGPPREAFAAIRTEAEVWMLVAEEDREEARSVLASAGLEPRRLGPHLVVRTEAAHKALPARIVLERSLELEDLEIEIASGSGRRPTKGGRS